MNLLSRILTPRTAEDRAGVIQLFDTFKQDNDSGTGIRNDYTQFASYGFFGSPSVRALMNARGAIFSEVRFAFRSAETEELYAHPSLAVLRRPSPGTTTKDLLARMIQDADLCGNAYVYRASATRLQRLRPDWVKVVHNTVEVGAYLYYPGGPESQNRPIVLDPSEVAHWRLEPHPLDPFMGATWLEAVARDVNLDLDMQRHKQSFMKNSATPNLIIQFEGKLNRELREQLRDEVDRKYTGSQNAFKTMLLEGNSRVVSVGHSFSEMDFARIQDAGETRIASAAGVPPVLVGMASGLAAATYSNYLHAMRRFADATLRPLWGGAAGALETIVPPPTPADSLDFDDRKVAALQQDARDDAEILQMQALAIGNLIRAGYEPDAVAKAVVTGKLDTLPHTGLVPVALYEDDIKADKKATGGNNGKQKGNESEDERPTD